MSSWVDRTDLLVMSDKMYKLLDTEEVQQILCDVFEHAGSNMLELNFQISTDYIVPNDSTIYCIDHRQNVVKEIEFKNPDRTDKY